MGTSCNALYAVPAGTLSVSVSHHAFMVYSNYRKISIGTEQIRAAETDRKGQRKML